MKNLIIMMSGLMVAGAISCTSARYAGKQYSDDVYYSPSDDIYTQSTAPSNTTAPDDYTEDNSNQQSEPAKQGNVTNNYYGDYNDYSSDDYYDYAYSSRIRRFYSPIYSYGYYDPWYTNAYWYNYNPYCYGSSIYLGYSWWYPQPWGWNVGWNSYYGWNMGLNMGWGYSPWGYYGMNYYNPYAMGYNQGYWNGYNNGLYASNNYYYNSYDANSYNNSYYGQRNSTASNGSREGVRSHAANYQNTVGEKAFNSRYTDVPKDIKSAEPGRMPNISSEPKGGTNVKKSSTIAPDRGKANEINNYNTPKGLDQRGGNEYSSPKGNTVRENPNGGTDKNVQPNRNIDIKQGSKDYSHPGRNKPDNTPKENKGNYGKPNFEQPKNVPDKGGNEPRSTPNYNQPKQQNNTPSSPRGGYNPAPSNSAPSYGGGNSGGGKISSPGVGGGGGSTGGGSRGSSSPAPSGGGRGPR